MFSGWSKRSTVQTCRRKKKEEAKNALRKFLEHPAVTAILGGLASAIR